MKRKASDEELREIVKKGPDPSMFPTWVKYPPPPIHWVDRAMFDESSLTHTSMYAHHDMPNVLAAILKWAGRQKTDSRMITIQFVEMKKDREYHKPRTCLGDLYQFPELFDFNGIYASERKYSHWRVHTVQFCPVIDVDIFKEENSENPVLWDLFKRGFATKKEIVQFTFQYLVDCLHQYIPKGSVKYFMDWGSGKGIHLWFTPVERVAVVNGKEYQDVSLGEVISRLIEKKGLWKKECMSPITYTFINRMCRLLTIKEALSYMGNEVVPYYKTLIRQYKNDYVTDEDSHKYSNFLIRRMDHGSDRTDGKMSFQDDCVLSIMYGFLYPVIDTIATGKNQTISLPYERNLKGFYRHHFWEPVDVMTEETFDIKYIDDARQKAESFVAKINFS
jgi:hypothetical protein